MNIDRASGGRIEDGADAAAGAVRSGGGRIGREVAEPVLLVLRMDQPTSMFAWEVRTYGALVLARGEGYATEALARAAGGRALIATSSPSMQPDAEGTAFRGA